MIQAQEVLRLAYFRLHPYRLVILEDGVKLKLHDTHLIAQLLDLLALGDASPFPISFLWASNFL